MIRRTGRKTLGYRVTATDAVVALVEAARQADSADEYAWKIHGCFGSGGACHHLNT
jgi:hypothetical protein